MVFRLSAFLLLVNERETEVAKEGFSLFFVLCRSNDGHGETKNVFEVFVGGLRENGVLLDAYSEIAHVINGRSRDAAKVASTRERNMN